MLSCLIYQIIKVSDDKKHKQVINISSWALGTSGENDGEVIVVIPNYYNSPIFDVVISVDYSDERSLMALPGKGLAVAVVSIQYGLGLVLFLALYLAEG